MPKYHQTSKKFKSYYVVWKPNGALSAIEILKVFKSYYVVWKLSEEEKTKLLLEGLNRTM